MKTQPSTSNQPRVLTPDEFFMENGGAELLAAHGIHGTGLAAYFGAALPAWPKDGIETGKTTRPAPMGSLAVVLVQEGRLTIMAHTAPPQGLPEHVVVERGISNKALDQLVRDSMHLPRPLMLLTVGVAYKDALADARIAYDLGSIEVCGKISKVLDGRRIERIDKVRERLGIPIKDMRTLAVAFETAMLRPNRPLSLPSNVKAIRKALGFKGAVKDVEAEDRAIRDGWEMVSALPPTIDAAWQAVMTR